MADSKLPGPSKVPGAPRVMQSQITYPEFIRMEGPTGDFSINIPTRWRAQFDDAPGRLVYAVENNAGFNSATLQVARISLSRLSISAGSTPADSQTSDWRQVVRGNITEADVAQALMLLAQQGLSTARESSAETSVIDTEIEAPEAGADATSLLWSARSAVQDFRESRIISGRALLRQGIVVFAVSTGSERFGAVSGSISSSGFGWEFNNRLVRIIQVNPARNRMKLSMLPQEEVPQERSVQRPPPQAPKPGRLVEDLKPFRTLIGQWLPGVVKQLRRNGVQVAVVSKTGAYAVGTVFMNQIQDGFVHRLEEVLSPGQEVKVQILAVNLQSKQLTLSMRGGFNHKKQDVRPFESVSSTEWFPGTVEKVKEYGSFVTVRQGRTTAEGLVRPWEMVGEPATGDAVEVRVLGVNVEKGSMFLSMKPPFTPSATGAGVDG
ncbi:ypfD [Symbiodinium pilosum]|uniref:YpfD protein n=1 Tax=Symbiodinium pilosum TaxID=2952 RepID=A0A812K3J5_SYMPI|nr:ypfD [Symbiodinium pilosum]